MDEIFQKVKEKTAEELCVDADKVTLESSFIEDLGADSLELAELIGELEEEFDLKISDEDASKLVCVKDAVEYINNIKNN